MEKCFVGLGVGTTALLAFGFGMVALHGPYNGDDTKKQVQTAPAPSNPVTAQNPPTTTAAAQLEPLPANAAFIPDEYLERLAATVDLAGARDQAPDKNLWTQVLPVAQKLMDGPCDCAQKVWLKHYIEMGNFALTDSVRQYHETAGLMATLGRNDAEAMALSKKAK